MKQGIKILEKKKSLEKSLNRWLQLSITIKKNTTIHGKEEESDIQSYYIIVLAMFISPQVKGIDRDHPYESPGIEYARQIL